MNYGAFEVDSAMPDTANSFDSVIIERQLESNIVYSPE